MHTRVYIYIQVENTSLSQGGTIATGASTLDELDALLEDVADDDEEKVRIDTLATPKSKLYKKPLFQYLFIYSRSIYILFCWRVMDAI